ncbi:MAG TPA: aldo/keto reductase [Devosiaceae bacterium]|nr:aldo/keto reductase [Devosiaceae bacterium]
MIPQKPEIAMGTGNLAVPGEREDANRLLDAYVDLGGGIIDTAAVYSDWVPGEPRRSEAAIGKWLKTRRGARPMIVTKGGHPPVEAMHRSRLDAASIRSDVEGSLAVLGIEQIDLYLLHRDDVARPVAEIMGPLAELVAEGKLAAVGVSNWSPSRIAEARATGLVPLASNQALGNVLSNHMGPDADPTIEKLDLAAFRQAEAADMSLMLFTSSAKGILSSPGRIEDRGNAAYSTPACRKAVKELVSIAEEAGIEPTNLGMAFLLQFSPRFVPVMERSSVDGLKTSMAAREVQLAPDLMAAIARVSGFDAYVTPGGAARH